MNPSSGYPTVTKSSHNTRTQ